MCGKKIILEGIVDMADNDYRLKCINKDCIDKGSTESVDSEILSCIKTKKC